MTATRERRALWRLVHELRCETEACLRAGPDDDAALDQTVALLRRLESRLEPSAGPVSPLWMLDLRDASEGFLSPIDFPEQVGPLRAVLIAALAP